MMKWNGRLSAVGLFLSLSLLAASDAEALVIESWVVGEASSTTEAAEASYERACRNWSMIARARAGSALLDLDCGTIQSVRRAYAVQFSSVAKIVIKDSAVGSTSNEEEIRSSYIPNSFSDPQGRAVDHWLKNCGRYEEFLTALSAGRLIAVSCGNPVGIGDSSGAQLASRSMAIFAKTGRGQTLISEETLMGTSLWQADPAKTRNSASKRWNENCLKFRSDLLAAETESPLFLDSSCGSAGAGRRLRDGSYVYQSTARVTLTIPAHVRVARREMTVSGSAYSTLAEAAGSFMRHCIQARAEAKETHGESYLWMSCGLPQVTRTSGQYQFRSRGTAFLR